MHTIKVYSSLHELFSVRFQYQMLRFFIFHRNQLVIFSSSTRLESNILLSFVTFRSPLSSFRISQKVGMFYIFDRSRAGSSTSKCLSCDHFHVIKLLSLSVHDRMNFFSIDANEISIFSVTYVSLVNFDVSRFVDCCG